ncbi:MAG: hypothetical protein IJN04_05660 [Clostridia bacterium]|nr:hypothetical protein [Clostridia bacterium]
MEKKSLIWICSFCIVFAFLFGVMGYRLTANDKTAVSIMLFIVGIVIAIGVSLFIYSIAVQTGKEIVMHIAFVVLCIVMGIAVFSIPNAQSGGGNKNDCRNCGRPRMNNSVYCEDCFESFYEWSQDYYDDKYN